jgi:hypothetical protein
MNDPSLQIKFFTAPVKSIPAAAVVARQNTYSRRAKSALAFVRQVVKGAS